MVFATNVSMFYKMQYKLPSFLLASTSLTIETQETYKQIFSIIFTEQTTMWINLTPTRFVLLSIVLSDVTYHELFLLCARLLTTLYYSNLNLASIIDTRLTFVYNNSAKSWIPWRTPTKYRKNVFWKRIILIYFIHFISSSWIYHLIGFFGDVHFFKSYPNDKCWAYKLFNKYKVYILCISNLILGIHQEAYISQKWVKRNETQTWSLKNCR
jgi:hypothetical protein